MPDSNSEEINWLDIFPLTKTLPPFIPPPFTIKGGVLLLFDETQSTPN